ncbi:threonine/serine dehydratase [Bacteriovoracaceae bacterium]|nr:threonine/serine dehydratase [Bacteriovoracaceae bacterium]
MNPYWNLEALKNIHQDIAPFIKKTPVLTSETLNSILSSKIFFKAENFQWGGAFKLRGAVCALRKLSKDQRAKGVITHSSGNHAQALAIAAKKMGIEATVVMPETSTRVKINAVRDYGAEVIFCKPSFLERERMTTQLIKQEGYTFIPPFDHQDIISGQSTAGKELIEEIDDLDMILVPVGGGGLLAGTALAAHHFGKSDCKVIGCEPEMADDAYRSFKAGKLIKGEDNPMTICDGLKTSLGRLNFAVIMNFVENIVTVDEKSIKNAMKFVFERLKIVVEPSSCAVVAALLEEKINVRNRRVGVILSGGNVNFPEGLI